jgi:hypothetical protein
LRKLVLRAPFGTLSTARQYVNGRWVPQLDPSGVETGYYINGRFVQGPNYYVEDVLETEGRLSQDPWAFAKVMSHNFLLPAIVTLMVRAASLLGVSTIAVEHVNLLNIYESRATS